MNIHNISKYPQPLSSMKIPVISTVDKVQGTAHMSLREMLNFNEKLVKTKV